MEPTIFWFLVVASLAVVGIKTLIIGGDFSFPLWFKYRAEYMDWYLSRPKFRPLPRLRK